MVLVMELPALIFYSAATHPGKFFAPKTVMVAGLLGILGVTAIYAYLPLRSMMNPPLNFGDTRTWEGFRYVALGGQIAATGSLSWERLVHFFWSLPQVYSWYGSWLTPFGRTLVAWLALLGLLTLAE